MAVCMFLSVLAVVLRYKSLPRHNVMCCCERCCWHEEENYFIVIVTHLLNYFTRLWSIFLLTSLFLVTSLPRCCCRFHLLSATAMHVRSLATHQHRCSEQTDGPLSAYVTLKFPWTYLKAEQQNDELRQAALIVLGTYFNNSVISIKHVSFRRAFQNVELACHGMREKIWQLQLCIQLNVYHMSRSKHHQQDPPEVNLWLTLCVDKSEAAKNKQQKDARSHYSITREHFCSLLSCTNYTLLLPPPFLSHNQTTRSVQIT